MKRTIALVLAICTLATPAFAGDGAGSCWRDANGDVLSFSDKDWTDVHLYKGPKGHLVSCERSNGDQGVQMDCGGAALPVAGMVADPAHPGKQALSYHGSLWRAVPCGSKINHEAL